jgi:YidC/Oxa1 family membrane protein insertase
MIEWTLEHIHIMGGVPWWGAIAATAILVRAVTFPLYLKSADQSARQAALTPITKPITERMQAAQKAGDQTGVMQAWTELGAIRKRAGLKYSAQFGPMLAQAVLGFCSFKLMRGMANLPVPGLKEGGFGWITDLTVSDGYLLLPAIMAGAMHTMFRYGGETGQSSDMMAPGMRNFMLWGMPTIIFFVTGWQPGAVCIWFVASGGWAMGQAMLMQKPAVRKFFGIAPMYRVKPGDGSTPSSRLMDIARSPAKNGGRTIHATATSKSASPSTGSYQAPNVRTTSARGAVAVPAFSPASSAPPPPKGSIVDQVKDQWNSVMAQSREKMAQRAERSNRDAIASAAASYERRAKEKREMKKRVGNK